MGDPSFLMGGPGPPILPHFQHLIYLHNCIVQATRIVFILTLPIGHAASFIWLWWTWCIPSNCWHDGFFLLHQLCAMYYRQQCFVKNVFPASAEHVFMLAASALFLLCSWLEAVHTGCIDVLPLMTISVVWLAQGIGIKLWLGCVFSSFLRPSLLCSECTLLNITHFVSHPSFYFNSR